MNKQNRPIAAWIGYLLDLWKVARGIPINPHSLNKFHILNSARKRSGSRQFIEVGTFLGVTTARCAKVFEKVYTIEISESLYQKAKRFLASRKNVEIFLGDGREWTLKLLQRSDVKDVLIFLDGHYSGGITGTAEVPEPALDELETLHDYRDKISAIVIDDFRTFGTQEGVPPKSTLLKTLEKLFPESDYEISVHLDQCIVIKREKLARAA